MFAVEDFARVVAPLSIEEQEERIRKLISARGLRLLKIEDDARKSCELDRKYSGSSKPLYIAHYETPDISRLPEGLKKELQSGRYRGRLPAETVVWLGALRIVVMLY